MLSNQTASPLHPHRQPTERNRNKNVQQVNETDSKATRKMRNLLLGKCKRQNEVAIHALESPLM